MQEHDQEEEERPTQAISSSLKCSSKKGKQEGPGCTASDISTKENEKTAGEPKNEQQIILVQVFVEFSKKKMTERQ